jgi:CDP-alcohol phosphatidyltransferase-like enzyme
MYEFDPRVSKATDRVYQPALNFLGVTLGITPTQISWASFVASAGAAVALWLHYLGPGLGLMALGQALDGFDGALARHLGVASEEGKRLDTLLDRASETVIFLGFAAGGFASWKIALMAITAVMLLTTIVDRSNFDPGCKRFVLYFGLWFPYPILFTIIFGVNLAAYVAGLLILDCKFQLKMDALGGDLDTVASRAAADFKL